MFSHLLYTKEGAEVALHAASKNPSYLEEQRVFL